MKQPFVLPFLLIYPFRPCMLQCHYPNLNDDFFLPIQSQKTPIGERKRVREMEESGDPIFNAITPVGERKMEESGNIDSELELANW